MVTKRSQPGLTDHSSSRLSWNELQDVYAEDLAEHFASAQAFGLDGPLHVFEQLFHDHRDDPDLAAKLVGIGRLRPSSRYFRCRNADVRRGAYSLEKAGKDPTR